VYSTRVRLYDHTRGVTLGVSGIGGASAGATLRLDQTVFLQRRSELELQVDQTCVHSCS
jgi:hypothetical protein